MHKLYELRDMLCEELEEYGSKDKLDVGGLEIVDKLAHAIKNIDKILEAEGEGYSNNYYYDDGMSYEGGMNGGNRGGSSNRGMYYRGGSYRRNSYARGQRRDSRGRYSRDADLHGELRELMEEAPDEQTRMEFEKFIRKLEQM